MILELKRQGLGVSAIARQTGLDRKTVRKYLERGLEAPVYGPREPGERLATRFGSYLTERLAAFPGLSARRLHREIKAMGYEGAYSTLTEYLRLIRPAVPREFERRFETGPGQQAQVDFAEFQVAFTSEPGVLRKVWLFSMVLGHSRWLWGRFCPNLTLETVMRCHIADRSVAAAERARADIEASAAVVHAARETAEEARREADRQAEAARAQSARIMASANDRAGVILSDAKLVGTKALKKARKRAARETQALRDEVRRMKAKTAIELRRGQLAAAFVRGRTFRLQERANCLSRDIETKAQIWAERERQHREAELRLARIEQERTAAEAAITQAHDTAAGILVTAEARVEEAQQALAKADADRIEAEGLVSAAREKASRITEAAEDRAGVIVADAMALATVTVRKSRKRAIAEARTRRAETDRAAAVAEREREAAETRAEQARLAQARAEAEREAAEEAAMAARAEAARVQQAAEAAADRIRTEAVAAAEAEQARADAARQARDEAEAARLAADQAAAEVIGKADAERAEAARATTRAQVVTAGLAALAEEMAAGTLGVREGGRVIARAPDLLRPAYPEIGPAVRAAATVAEQTRAARREAEDVARATEDAQKKAMDEIARARVEAKSEIDCERDAARTEIETERQAMTTELQTKRGEVELQSAELERRLTRVGWLLNMLERLWPKFVRWLSHPDLPAAIKDEGIGIAAEAVSVLGALRQDDPDP